MMQGPALSTPVTKKCSNIGLECVVFLNNDFYERKENYLPKKGIGKGIYFVDIAFMDAGWSCDKSNYLFFYELFFNNF